MTKVAVLVGSLRRDSLNLKLAKALAKLGESKGLALQIVPLGELPLYNEDLWENPPASVLAFKEAVAATDAVLFVTPEYNRSFPGVLKNALDWGSRPYGQSVWPNKPAGIVGTSPGAAGTAAAQAQLRSAVAALGVALISQPEVYLNFKPDLIDAEGQIAEERTSEFLDRYLETFNGWLQRLGVRQEG